MRRDTRLKWCIIVGMVILDAVLIRTRGLEFVWNDLKRPFGFSLVLGGVCLYYHRRRVENFVLCLLALIQLVLFSSSYTILMYGLCTLSNPLIDEYLVRWDAWMGFHLPSIVAWAGNHPTLTGTLRIAYDTLLFQTAAVVAVLGLLGDRKPLETFMLAFMISAMVTVAIFAVWPAEGPFSEYGYEASDVQQAYLNHFHSLRSGERTLIGLTGAEGLITFPSFHTTWAMLLAWAFWHRKWLFVVSAIINVAVIVSTLTTGWHYFSDVLAGVVVGLAALTVCWMLRGWLYSGVLTKDEPDQPQTF